MLPPEHLYLYEIVCKPISVPFEELDSPLVVTRLRQGRKGAEVAALAGFRVFLARIQAVFAGLQLADHCG